MLVVSIILFIIIFLFAVYYFLIHFKKMSFIARFSKPRWLSWVLAAIPTVICIFMFLNILGLTAAIVLFLLYSFLITDLLNLIVKKFIKAAAAQKMWTKLHGTGILAIVFTLMFIGVSYLTAIHVVNTKYDLDTNKNLGVPDLKISLISDLHLGTTMNVNKLKKYCEEIQASEPDLVVLVGDMFDENTPKGSMEAACKLFGQLKSTYGVYYVYGNHDMGGMGRNPYFSTEDIAANFTANKVNVLADETKLINNQFYIIGRKDASMSHKAKRRSIEELLQGVDKSKFILMLDHQPLDLKKAAASGIDLQLSGHTHGGQLWPSGLLSQLFHSTEMNYGLKEIDNYKIIVTSGIGGWNYPLRLGSKSEIVQIQLHSSSTNK